MYFDAYFYTRVFSHYQAKWYTKRALCSSLVPLVHSMCMKITKIAKIIHLIHKFGN